ncbi:hypothetical protein [Modestobacter marinus]|uniref:hypothetical protein n=1 Tax=Modestobacter marinus TaxID=477641 RepID=UPI0034D58DDC
MDVIDVTSATRRHLPEVAGVHVALDQHLELDWLRERNPQVPCDDLKSVVGRCLGDLRDIAADDRADLAALSVALARSAPGRPVGRRVAERRCPPTARHDGTRRQPGPSGRRGARSGRDVLVRRSRVPADGRGRGRTPRPRGGPSPSSRRTPRAGS